MESSLQVLSPNEIQLSCSAESLPLPTFYWIRVTRDNSETLFNVSTMQGNKSFTVMNSDANGVFTITPTTAIDTATYVCMAINRLGSSTSNSIVNVYGMLMPSVFWLGSQLVYIVSEYFLQIYSFVDMSVIMSLKAQFLLWLISRFFFPKGENGNGVCL